MTIKFNIKSFHYKNHNYSINDLEFSYFFLALSRFSKISGSNPFLTELFTNMFPDGVLMNWSGVSLKEGKNQTLLWDARQLQVLSLNPSGSSLLFLIKGTTMHIGPHGKWLLTVSGGFSPCTRSEYAPHQIASHRIYPLRMNKLKSSVIILDLYVRHLIGDSHVIKVLEHKEIYKHLDI